MRDLDTALEATEARHRRRQAQLAKQGSSDAHEALIQRYLQPLATRIDRELEDDRKPFKRLLRALAVYNKRGDVDSTAGQRLALITLRRVTHAMVAPPRDDDKGEAKNDPRNEATIKDLIGRDVSFELFTDKLKKQKGAF